MEVFHSAYLTTHPRMYQLLSHAQQPDSSYLTLRYICLDLCVTARVPAQQGGDGRLRLGVANDPCRAARADRLCPADCRRRLDDDGQPATSLQRAPQLAFFKCGNMAIRALSSISVLKLCLSFR